MLLLLRSYVAGNLLQTVTYWYKLNSGKISLKE